MASHAQIEANRLNALKSTGPRSVEGRAASRFNAMKHGVDAVALVIPGEDPEALEKLSASYHERFDPQSPEEDFLVTLVVRAEWMTHRLARLEDQVFTSMMNRVDPSSETPLAAAFEQDITNAKMLDKIFRRQKAAKTEWQQAMATLRQLQRERAALAMQAAQLDRALNLRNEPDFPLPEAFPEPEIPLRGPAYTPNDPQEGSR